MQKILRILTIELDKNKLLFNFYKLSKPITNSKYAKM